MQCPLCGQAMQPWLTLPTDWRRPKQSGRIDIAWCDACDFGSLAPRPHVDEIAGFYQVDEYYTHAHDADAGNAEDRALMNRLRVRLAWQFDRGTQLDRAWFRRRYFDRQVRFCDIGCGAGGLLDIIKKAGYEAIGVDPDPAARKWATELGLTVVEGMAEQLPDSILNERFDGVFMTHTLEHCLDSVRAVQNAMSLVKPDGVVVIETPNNACIARKHYGPCWLHIDAPRHLNFFTERSLKLVCEKAGCKVQEVEYAGFTRQFLGDIIRQQKKIWQCFAEQSRKAAGASPMKEPTTWEAWKLLLATFYTSEALKYDSVRVIATHA